MILQEMIVLYPVQTKTKMEKPNIYWMENAYSYTSVLKDIYWKEKPENVYKKEKITAQTPILTKTRVNFVQKIVLSELFS